MGDRQEADVDVVSVKETQTKSGHTRFVVRDADGREFTTFRPPIGREAAAYEGKRAHVTWHEEDRNGFHNVYLDAIGPAAAAAPAGGASAGDGEDTDEVAWNTAVEAAPWLIGTREPEEPVEPEELFERLEPFKRLVAEDIRKDAGDDEPSE